MSRITKKSGRGIFLAGVTLALLLAGASTLTLKTQSLPKGKTRIEELDAKAQPFFNQAKAAIPEAVAQMTSGKNLMRLYWLIIKDKCSGSSETEPFILSHLEKSVIQPCREGAAIYGIETNNSDFSQPVREIGSSYTTASLYAVSSLTVESFFLKTTIPAIGRVLASATARIGLSCGSGALCALADGPLPVGDIIGVVLAVGGTVLSIHDQWTAKVQLPIELSEALTRTVQEYQDACRLAAMR